MAQVTTIRVTCDLPHEPGEGEVPGIRTRTISLDGSTVDIDVCAPHDEDLDSVFGQYAGFGRRAASKTADGRRASRSAPARRRSGEIRAWAKAHGISVSERGRIPAGIVAQYEEAEATA